MPIARKLRKCVLLAATLVDPMSGAVHQDL